MLDLIDELRMEGLSADLPLPQIVVIGDQSSGKSSTLEALSGIQLPRGSSKRKTFRSLFVVLKLNTAWISIIVVHSFIEDFFRHERFNNCSFDH